MSERIRGSYDDGLYKSTYTLLYTSHSARNLSFIFDEHLTFSDQITSLFKAREYHICRDVFLLV